MDDNAIVYRVFSMHGETVYCATYAGYEKLVERMWTASRNAGPYRIIYLPTGDEVARFDRNDDGSERPGTDTIQSALEK